MKKKLNKDIADKVIIPKGIWAKPKDYYRIFSERFLKTRGLLRQTVYSDYSANQYVLEDEHRDKLIVPKDAEIAYNGDFNWQYHRKELPEND